MTGLTKRGRIGLLEPGQPPPTRCRYCKRHKGDHQAGTFACPFGRGAHPQFRRDQHYVPSKPRTPRA